EHHPLLAPRTDGIGKQRRIDAQLGEIDRSGVRDGRQVTDGVIECGEDCGRTLEGRTVERHQLVDTFAWAQPLSSPPPLTRKARGQGEVPIEWTNDKGHRAQSSHWAG